MNTVARGQFMTLVTSDEQNNDIAEYNSAYQEFQDMVLNYIDTGSCVLSIYRLFNDLISTLKAELKLQRAQKKVQF